MCKRTARHIVLLLFIVLALPCFGQDFPIIHFTKKEGFPANMVYQVYRDRTGFLWFATDKGVARYNGIKFETFTTSDGLTDNDVISIFEDHYGRIWLNCFKGNLCYYKDGKIYSAANTDFLNLPFNTSHAFGFSFEKDSSFTLLFSDREIFINIKGDSCRVYYLNKVWGKGPNDLAVAVSKRSPSTYELFTGHGKMLIDTNYNIISTQSGPHKRHRCRIGQNMCYIVAEEAVYEDNKLVYRFKGPNEVYDNVNSLYINKADTFLGTEKGLVINNSEPILKTSRISDVSQDVNGNYWVSTLNNGVYYFNKHFPDIKVYNNCYTGMARYAFAEKGTLFFATSDRALLRFDKGKTTALLDLAKYRKRNEGVPQPGYLMDDKGTYHFIIDQDHFIMQQLLADKPLIKRNHIIESPVNNVTQITATKVICSTPQYIYFLHIGYYIMRIDLSKINTGNASALEDVVWQSDGQRIYFMGKSADNSIWFSTAKGMYKLVNGTAELQASFKGLSLNRFYILGDYMVGWNNNNKLTICNNISGRMTVDTLPLQDCIWDKAYPLDEHHLLISTNNEYRILKLTPGQGQPVYELSTVTDPIIPGDAEHIFSDGHTCYFFKDGNITAIPVAVLLHKAVPPQLFFTGVSASGKTYAISDHKVSLPYSGTANIHVSFAALAFGMTNLSYEYRVSGEEEDNWRVIKNEEINLLPSRSGDYTITIRAKSAVNAYSEPVSLLLTIAPPFWTSWWFIILTGLCIAALLWGVIRLVIRYFVKKKEQVHASEIKFLKLEYKALNALMNPHFIFNSLNNIQGLVNGDNRQAANQYLVIFADLIRQNMHNASKELITLEKEMELIRNYL
ncbi:MAG TPA: histidine kinase, partial [Chitinophaga sp.]